MNKSFTILMVFVLASVGILFASSCTKQFTCKCEMTYSGQPGLPEPSEREYSITDSKKNAENLCSEKSGSWTKNGITTVESCQLW